MVLTQIHTGDWNKVSGVDFGEGATSLDMSISSETTEGSIEVYIDGKPGDDGAKRIATIALENTTGNDVYETVSASLTEAVSGSHQNIWISTRMNWERGNMRYTLCFRLSRRRVFVI